MLSFFLHLQGCDGETRYKVTHSKLMKDVKMECGCNTREVKVMVSVLGQQDHFWRS